MTASGPRSALAAAQLCGDGVAPIRPGFAVVALRANLARQLAAEILVPHQAVQHVAEVVPRGPPKLRAGLLVDVDAIEAGEELPAAGGVERLAVGKQPPLFEAVACDLSLSCLKAAIPTGRFGPELFR